METKVLDQVEDHTHLSYASGSGTTKLVFSLAIAAGNAATNADDVLSIGAQSIALKWWYNQGYCRWHYCCCCCNIWSALGTAAGTLTVTA